MSWNKFSRQGSSEAKEPQKSEHWRSRIYQALAAIFITSLISVLFFPHPPAYAHSPHDVVTRVEISPDFRESRTLFVISRGNLLKSQDEGKSWERPFQGLDNTHNFSDLSIASKSTVFLASKGDGIYRSEDEGNHWQPVNEGLESLDISHLCTAHSSPSVLLARDAQNRLYRTENNGGQWERTLLSQAINTIECSNHGNELFVTDQSGNFFTSTDTGKTWIQGFSFRDTGKITAIASISHNSSTLIFVGTDQGEVFTSQDQGRSFSKAEGHLKNDSIWDLQTSIDESGQLLLFASTRNEGFFRSNDQGETWKKYSKGLTKTGQADQDERSHFKEIAITQSFSEDGIIFLAGFDGLFKTSDGGNQWQELDTLSPRAITALSISPNYREDSTIAVGAYKDEAYISRDSGKNWHLINSGLSRVLFNRYGDRKIEVHTARFYDIKFSPNYALDETVFAVLNYYYYISKNAGKTWQEVRTESRKGYSSRGRFIAISPDFKSDQTVYLVTRYGGLTYQSTDGGRNFSIVGAIEEKINGLVISPNYAQDKTLYASGATGIYKTSDAGKTWTLMTSGSEFENETWRSVAISPDYVTDQTLFAGSETGLFKTEDSGQSWIALKNASIGDKSMIKMIGLSPNYAADKTLIVGIQGKGAFRSDDGGESFQSIGAELQERNIPLLPFDTVPVSSASIQFSPAYKDDNTLFAFGSASADVFKSTDGGDTWEMIAIAQQRHQTNEALATQFKIGKTAIQAYPIPRMISALLGAVGIYFTLGQLMQFLGNAKTRWFQFFGASLTFVLIFGTLTISL
ncbi:MAG: WD40/YVTN/BNR-like repeat-containing protein [Leptolyngbyaceae cyanobacterium]